MAGDGEARGAARGGKNFDAARSGHCFDLGAVRRVPGGIASHRVTLEVVGPSRSPPAADARG